MSFACVACGSAITGPLTELAEVPVRPMDQGDSKDGGTRTASATMPRGCFAVEPEHWGAPYVPREDPVAIFPGGPCVCDPEGDNFLVSAGPRGTVVLHPGDAPGLEPVRALSFDDVGCCGLSGRGGMNRRCPCGAPMGTEVSDCSTPYELHLDPGQVRWHAV